MSTSRFIVRILLLVIFLTSCSPATMMRESHAPANVAVELIIANGQRALLAGDYSQVEALDKVLAEILAAGRLDNPVARDYLDIVLAAAKAGYEALNLDIQGDHANVRVTAKPPMLTDLKFQKLDGIWQIQPQIYPEMKEHNL